MGAILRVRGRDLDLDAGTLTVARTKNGDPITAGLSSAAIAELRRVPKVGPDELVFGTAAASPTASENGGARAGDRRRAGARAPRRAGAADEPHDGILEGRGRRAHHEASAQRATWRLQYEAEQKRKQARDADRTTKSTKKKREKARERWTLKWLAAAHNAHPDYGAERLMQEAHKIAALNGMDEAKRDKINKYRAEQYLKTKRSK